MQINRRHWVSACLATAAWPELLAAFEHAHNAATSQDVAFQTLDPETAQDIEAVAAQIIPSTDGPGAREAGVIYFIDRALSTFAAGDREAYRAGMEQLQRKRRELFPSSTCIHLLSAEEQVALIRSIETSDFFELLRKHTVLGFLGNPSYGGNRGFVGWQQIGFDHQMAYQPPFGYYDAQTSEPK